MHTSCIVKKINWSEGAVQAVCADGRIFEAGKLLVTVPAGVLQAGPGAEAGIAFSPGVEAYTGAMQQIGFGTVTKVLLQFKTAFWNSYAKNIGFILGEASIPTWWTQHATSCLLTGWLAGPAAAALKGADEATLLQAAIGSLAIIFNKTEEELREAFIGGGTGGRLGAGSFFKGRLQL